MSEFLGRLACWVQAVKLMLRSGGVLFLWHHAVSADYFRATADQSGPPIFRHRALAECDSLSWQEAVFRLYKAKLWGRKEWKPVFIFLVGHLMSADFRETCLFSVWSCFSCRIYKVYLNNNKDKIFLNVRANLARSFKERNPVCFHIRSSPCGSQLILLLWVRTWWTKIVGDIPLGDVWEVSGWRVLIGALKADLWSRLRDLSFTLRLFVFPSLDLRTDGIRL